MGMSLVAYEIKDSFRSPAINLFEKKLCFP